ncbi:MAG TPA: hypothetical protein V6C58_07975, partial [Allocoleopsis sp.]
GVNGRSPSNLNALRAYSPKRLVVGRVAQKLAVRSRLLSPNFEKKRGCDSGIFKFSTKLSLFIMINMKF